MACRRCGWTKGTSSVSRTVVSQRHANVTDAISLFNRGRAHISQDRHRVKPLQHRLQDTSRRRSGDRQRQAQNFRFDRRRDEIRAAINACINTLVRTAAYRRAAAGRRARQAHPQTAYRRQIANWTAHPTLNAGRGANRRVSAACGALSHQPAQAGDLFGWFTCLFASGAPSFGDRQRTRPTIQRITLMIIRRVLFGTVA